MHNVETFRQELMIYVVVMIGILLVIWPIINSIFLVLHITKLFRERKVWIRTNVMGVVILIAVVSPALLDVYTESYCAIENVVNIEADQLRNNSTKYMLVTDKNGNVYTCYDYLIDEQSLKKDINYPGTVIYAKHSKLFLRYYSQGVIQQKE